MKILVLSDSHSALRFMRQCVTAISPDAVIHLGDHYDDGEALAEEFSNIRFYQVPGNCDRYRGFIPDPEIRVEKVCGVLLYFTHGHRHQVKTGQFALLRDARAAQVQAVLYGHTHEAYCSREGDGLWVLNPGASGYYGGSAGLIAVEGGQILSCNILRGEDIEKLSLASLPEM